MRVAILDVDGRFTGRTYSGPLVHVPLRPGETWVPWSPELRFDPPTREIDPWREVRRERDRRLSETDWIVLRAVERGEPAPPEWLAYRQALRDVTKQPDPEAIDWPEAP